MTQMCMRAKGISLCVKAVVCGGSKIYLASSNSKSFDKKNFSLA